MKIHIGNFKNWYGPYQLASTLCFWAKKEKDEIGMDQEPDWVHDFGEWLAYGSVAPDEDIWKLGDDDRKVTLLFKFLTWIESKRHQKVEIRMDDDDVDFDSYKL